MEVKQFNIGKDKQMFVKSFKIHVFELHEGSN